MTVPSPTPILRMVHVGCLATLIRREAIHAPNRCPNDGLPYPSIHDAEVREKRATRGIPCGPRGEVEDYVSFYFGPHGPMLLQLHTGRVVGYTEREDPLIYLVATVDSVLEAGCQFVFSDGHGLATFTRWFADPSDLDKVDWGMVNADYWANTLDDQDRQRRKQAEFLVHHELPWSLVEEIAVRTEERRAQVVGILDELRPRHRPRVVVRGGWYYS